MSRIILVSASPLEHDGDSDIYGVPIFQVGIGKINAASNLTEIISNAEPDIVVNFGSCGNLKNYKVGQVLEVGEVINDFDTHGLSENPIIRLSNTDVKCFTTDIIYNNTHQRYSDSYNQSIKDCTIVDMECYALAHVCKQRDILFYSFKWVSDDGEPDSWEKNAKIGFENFKEVFINTFLGEDHQFKED